MPFFSVIIPAYNSAEFIRKCLDSVKCQSFTDYELIVVCDSCTDDTAVIAQEYTDKILIVDYQRDGLSRNAGLDVAEGKYIIFIDSDDWFVHEYVFRQLYDALKDEQYDLLNYGIVWKGVGYHPANRGEVVRAVAGHVWRMEFIGDTRFDDGVFSSDTRFLDELISKRPIPAWLNMPVYYYNAGREGSLCNLHARGLLKGSELTKNG